MTTLENIKKAAQAKNWKVEETETHVGVMLSDYVWYWWTILSNGDCISNHIYSQNTGKTSRSFRRFYAAEEKIEKIAV